MLKHTDNAAQNNKFRLKDEFVELVRARRDAGAIFVSLAELEASRTKQLAVPASKHGHAPA